MAEKSFWSAINSDADKKKRKQAADDAGWCSVFDNLNLPSYPSLMFVLVHSRVPAVVEAEASKAAEATAEEGEGEGEGEEGNRSALPSDQLISQGTHFLVAAEGEGEEEEKAEE